MTDEIKTTANSGFALWGLTCFVETFVQGSTFLLRMNSSAKNPPQRKAAKRYVQPYPTAVLTSTDKLTFKASITYFSKNIFCYLCNRTIENRI